MFKSLKLFSGLNISLEQLSLKIVELGYKRQGQVNQEGDFACRGGILDIFPYSFELPIRVEMEANIVSSVRSFNFKSGELLWQHNIAIILPIRKSLSFKSLPTTEDFPLSNFLDIKSGDYVVHNQHGIGKFLGFAKIKSSGAPKDHLVIQYDCGEKLYVPTDSMHLVQKYIAFHSRRPRLHKLGSRKWDSLKAKVRNRVQKLAWDLLTLQAIRLSSKGFIYPQDTKWQQDFEASFPYEETPDQINVTLDVKKDMESGKLMDRLLCGDVGYGKTEVAMRAAFKTVMGGRQVAYLVPTTILAEQHFQNFSARMKDFPINIRLLCRFNTGKEQGESLKSLKEGGVDIIIGTHRLLSQDVEFKDLGLIIIDEEQRFGVKAKEKLKGLKANANVITLTATPIPRTLYLSLMSARDLSVINTPPQNRLPIETIVVEYDEDLVCQAILKEFKRNGQVFFLHNRIDELEAIAARLKKILPSNIRIGIGHGRMRPKDLEGVMTRFLKGELDCLISTTIIESGIDIPNANTIIINHAHMFGLSDMHQLRGRVGRFNKKAYAYFFLPKNACLENDARRRLEAIVDYARLGAGFNIAMQDLEIRGAGNLLGLEQHGFIVSVGFDLYCRLLREAVLSFKKAGVFDEYKN